MSLLRSIALLVVGLAAGFGLGVLHRPSEREVPSETIALRAQLDEVRQAEQHATHERDTYRTQVAELEKTVGEVHRLRGQVSELKTELAETPKTAAASGFKGPTAKFAGNSGKADGVRNGVMTLDEAPPVIRTAIVREMGDGLTVRGIVAETGKDGAVSFMTKGQLADGRGRALRVAEDGSVLERRSEISTEMVPAEVQEVFSQNFADFAIGHATETTTTDQTSYDLTGKRADAAVELTVRADGTIVGYSARFRSADTPAKSPGKK